jgi:hypothetical protein
MVGSGEEVVANLRTKLEQQLFRRINGVVEPMVRRGFVSSKLAPASLIVLETIGFKSGQLKRTPVWSLGLGRYRIVGTARGGRSFWVKNLLKDSDISYFLGGKAVSSEAIVMAPAGDNLNEWNLSPLLSRLTSGLSRYVKSGWAFAVLVPAAD